MIIKIYLLFLLCVFSFSCTQVGIGYRIATGQIRGKISDAFDFEPSHKSRKVDFFLSDEFEKNKKPLFQKAIKALTKFNDIIQKDELSEAEINFYFIFLQSQQIEVISLFEPCFKMVIDNIQDHEVKNFKKYLENLNSKNELKIKNETEFKNDKIKNFSRVFNFVFDSVSTDQEKLIAKFVNNHFAYYKNQLTIRKDFNTQFINLYPDKIKMLELSLNYYKADTKIRSSEYQLERLTFENDFKIFLLEYWKSTSSDQKMSLKKIVESLLSALESSMN